MLIRRLDAEAYAAVSADLADRLALAEAESGVWAAIASFACGYLGASQTLSLRRSKGEKPDEVRFSSNYAPAGLASVADFCSAARLSGIGLVPAPPAGGARRPFGAIFDALPRAAGVVYAEVTPWEVLLLVYEDSTPVLSRRSWMLVDDMRRQAAAALVRVRGGEAPDGVS